MRRSVIITVVVIFVVALLARAMTYTVKFTEAAVKTTFGSADESDVKREPGLRFKWPQPIQSVTTYDTRTRFAETKSETQQTADNSQIVVHAFCAWRVDDPLRFFTSFSNAGSRADDHYKRAKDTIISSLRSAMGETSKYRLTELFTPQGTASRLQDLEKAISVTLDQANMKSYGIRITMVGIDRIELPEETTKSVLQRMKSDRSKLVEESQSKGDAIAQTIVQDARAKAGKIEQFARNFAEEERAKGNREAEQYVAMMNEAPELAIFLKNLEFIRESWSKRMTLIFRTDEPAFQLFSINALGGARTGQVPGVDRLMGSAAPASEALARPRPGDTRAPAAERQP